MNIPAAHVEILAAAAAVGSVFAELFMIKSLLVFDPKTDEPSADDSTDGPLSPRYKQSAVRSASYRDLSSSRAPSVPSTDECTRVWTLQTRPCH
jgi:hypothetical protein